MFEVISQQRVDFNFASHSKSDAFRQLTLPWFIKPIPPDWHESVLFNKAKKIHERGVAGQVWQQGVPKVKKCWRRSKLPNQKLLWEIWSFSNFVYEEA